MSLIVTNTPATSGTVYGRRTVLGQPFRARLGKNNKRETLAVVECRCGSVDAVRVSEMENGRSGNCVRCKRKHTTHGHSCNYTQSRLYTAWVSMRSRVFNRAGTYLNYANIDIDPRWDTSFEAFYADMGDHPGAGYSLDRIDNERGYWPDNCRWATAKEQSRNTSRTVYVEYRNERKPLSEWSDEFGIDDDILYHRVVTLGWDAARAFTEPVRKKARTRGSYTFDFRGETKSVSEWAKEYGIPLHTLRRRVFEMGWNAERALTEPPRRWPSQS